MPLNTADVIVGRVGDGHEVGRCPVCVGVDPHQRVSFGIDGELEKLIPGTAKESVTTNEFWLDGQLRVSPHGRDERGQETNIDAAIDGGCRYKDAVHSSSSSEARALVVSSRSA